MASFKVMLWIYNLWQPLVITPLDSKFSRFKVEALPNGNDAMFLNYSQEHSWNAEKVTMKFFTKDYIHQLGKLIEKKRPELF